MVKRKVKSDGEGYSATQATEGENARESGAYEDVIWVRRCGDFEDNL